MTRRHLLGLSLLSAAARPAVAQPRPRRPAPEWYELRAIQLRIGQDKVATDFFSEAGVPALRRAGAGPVGLFRTSVGPEMPTLHLLVPWPTLAAFEAGQARLAADPAWRDAAAYQAAPAATPAFVRQSSALLAAFENLPRLEVPKQTAEKKPRLFELRVYESPSGAGHGKKMEMFTRLGELEIFRRVGLTPVFFGRTVIGPRMPSFVYMLVFPDMATREKAWADFRADPEWLKLKATPGYSDAEIMSNITDLLLAPLPASQI